MSATDAKKDNLPKSALELLEEDDEFEVLIAKLTRRFTSEFFF